METEIHNLLDRIERDRNIRILYACESGSRAWGFASPDSDYDIRFVFVRPEKDYLSILDGLESVELPLEGELDAGGWDLRKALRLLGKSNGALVEWLHSPIVYRSAPGFRERWQNAASAVFSPKHSSAHYRGLAKQMVAGKLNAPQVRAKDYLYALRALLCAKWISMGKGIPPVRFSQLMPVAPPEIVALVPALLEHKQRTAEGELMPRVDELDIYLTSVLEEPISLAVKEVDHSILDALFRSEIRLSAGVPSKESFTLDRVRESDLMILDTVAGSRAYGTDVEGSDTDRRGVFIAPHSFISGLEEIGQVSDERNDEVMYELGHLVSLLLKNNPNALELLAMPEDCIFYRHPVFEMLKPEIFLSKLCLATFGEYAFGQIRKARGLNKKIVNPQPEQRRQLLEFCHVPDGQGSLPVLDWLDAREIDPRKCALTSVRHAPGMYAIYHDPSVTPRGLVSFKDPDSLVFTSVPPDAVPLVWMHCNEDAFRAHCRAHREYWEWVGQRNEDRYTTNISHGRGYDSKNLMHTLRLLDVADEIAREGIIHVRRPDREFLLRVKNGEFGYEQLLSMAETKFEKIKIAFEQSSLPERPDRDRVIQLLVEIRAAF